VIPPPYTYAAGRLAEERMREPRRDGEHARLMRMAKPARAGPLDRLLAGVGGLLVSVGKELQAGRVTRARSEPFPITHQAAPRPH
jgi:hypothetical protein